MSDVSDEGLPGFIRDRLDEEVRVAHVAAQVFPPPWEVNDRGHSARVVAGEPVFRDVATLDQSAVDGETWPGEPLEHIGLHDPARAFAFVGAGRALLAVHYTPATAAPDDWRVSETSRTSWERHACVGCGRSGPCDDYVVEHIDRCPSLRAFALTWSGHERYRAGWRPE